MFLSISKPSAYSQNVLSTSSLRQQAINVQVPAAHVVLEGNTQQHFLRSTPSIGAGGVLEVPPLKSISQVFDKFKVILFLLAQFSMFLTSIVAESLFVFTGALTVISSANLTNTLVSGFSGFISSRIENGQ